MSDQNEALARLAQQREVEGRAAAGDEAHWKAAMTALEKRIKAGDLGPDELQRRLIKETSGTDIFYSGIAESSESEWRAWRDNQPLRRARIDRCK